MQWIAYYWTALFIRGKTATFLTFFLCQSTNTPNLKGFQNKGLDKIDQWWVQREHPCQRLRGGTDLIIDPEPGLFPSSLHGLSERDVVAGVALPWAVAIRRIPSTPKEQIIRHCSCCYVALLGVAGRRWYHVCGNNHHAYNVLHPVLKVIGCAGCGVMRGTSPLMRAFQGNFLPWVCRNIRAIGCSIKESFSSHASFAINIHNVRVSFDIKS